jgi:hypothetical protein
LDTNFDDLAGPAARVTSRFARPTARRFATFISSYSRETTMASGAAQWGS